MKGEGEREGGGGQSQRRSGHLTSSEQRIPVPKHTTKPLIRVFQLKEDASATWNLNKPDHVHADAYLVTQTKGST